MFQPDRPDRATIVRLRVKSAGLDPLTAQQRVAHALNTASLYPAGLPPAAILCIRRLVDPRPGSLRLQHGGLHPPPEWQQAIASQIDQLARHAARPIHGPVPANAKAVLFADRSEWLACLAMDWCAGEAVAHWWWESLFRNRDVARAVIAEWLGAIEFVPPALHHLAAKRLAVPFIRRLDDDTAHRMWQAMVYTFGLAELHVAWHESPGGEPVRHSEAATPGQPARRESGPLPLAPWRRWLPDVELADLGREQQCTLGLGLVLQRAPAAVRTPGFARAVAEWYHRIEIASRDTTPGDEAPVLDLVPEQNQGPRTSRPATMADDGISWPAIAPAQPSSHASHEPGPVQAAFHPDIGAGPASELSPGQPPAAQPVAGSRAPATPAVRARARRDDAVAPIPGDTIQPEPIASAATSLAEARFEIDEVTFEYEIDTVFGGIFYLINLGLFLNLYSDFTTPLTPGIALPIWDWIALVGQELVGEQLHTDAVWGLLARLAGRTDDQAPGTGFEPPDEWRLPPAWLAPFGEGAAWQWASGEQRLWVHHPAGFCVLDIAIGRARPATALRRALGEIVGPAPLEVKEAGPGSETRTGLTRLERWLHWLLPYVRARLRLAFGVADSQVPDLLCRHHAHVVVTATRLDLYLALAGLPIQIRLSGLDRDPGWVPAAGRFVAFHFYD